jgi:hypothetical protein
MKRLLFLLLFLPLSAHADVTVQKWLHSGSFFAVKAQCPPNGAYTVLLGRAVGFYPPVEFGGGVDCVNGEIGIENRVPFPPFGTDIFMLVEFRVYTEPNTSYDPKIVINYDCMGDKSTECVADPLTPSVSGRITWPGDEDWIKLLPRQQGEYNLTVRNKPGCHIAASLVHEWDETPETWLRVAGTPSGCAYTVSLGRRP